MSARYIVGRHDGWEVEFAQSGRLHSLTRGTGPVCVCVYVCKCVTANANKRVGHFPSQLVTTATIAILSRLNNTHTNILYIAALIHSG